MIRVYFCLSLLFVCCGKPDEGPSQLLGAWSLPSMPAIEVEIDEVFVAAEDVDSFFRPVWANFCSEQALNPNPTFSPNQFVQYKLNEVKDFIGEELLRREAKLYGITVSELKKQFITYAPEISEAQVMELYTKLVLDPLPPASEREQQPFDYKDVAPRIRKQLREQAGAAEQDRWLEDRLGEVVAVFNIEGIPPIFIYGG